MVAVYSGLGYELVTLPLASVAERVRFVRAAIEREESQHGASRDLAGVRRGNGREKRTMNMLDVDAIRAQVRALDFTRGTPADAAMRREDDAAARANLAIEEIGRESCRARLGQYV